MLLYKMMGNKPYRPLKWRAPIRSPSSTKASAMATRGITKTATVRIKNWFQEWTIALVLLCAGEQALQFFSQRHDGRQAQYEKCQHQERREGGSPKLFLCTIHSCHFAVWGERQTWNHNGVWMMMMARAVMCVKHYSWRGNFLNTAKTNSEYCYYCY